MEMSKRQKITLEEQAQYNIIQTATYSNAKMKTGNYKHVPTLYRTLTDAIFYRATQPLLLETVENRVELLVQLWKLI